MKKSQRHRLSQLLAREGSLNYSERLEATWLKALAAENPDAGNDEDDTPSGFRVSLMNAVSGRKTLSQELAAANARIAELSGLPVSASAPQSSAPPAPISAMSGATDGVPFVAGAQRRAESLAAQLEEVRGSLAAANERLKMLAGAVGLKFESYSNLSLGDFRQALDSRLSGMAGEKVAELGFPASMLPPSQNCGQDSDSLEDIQAELKTCSDANRAGELAAKANAIRDKQWGGNKK